MLLVQRLRTILALVLVLSIVFGGLQPLVGAARSKRHILGAQHGPAIADPFLPAWLPLASATAVEPADPLMLRFGGGRIFAGRALPGISANLSQARQAVATQREALASLLRQPRFAGTKGDRLRRVMARLDKASRYVEIAYSTGEERHRLIRQLPVTITATNAVADGRLGSYREYVAKGKVRVRVFVPDAGLATPPLSAARASEQPDGSVPADSNPTDDCYWEDEDGSWEGPCVTQQEVDDALILDADLAAEAEQNEEDAINAYNEFDNWCQSNYPACEGEQKGHEEFIPQSGPSVWEVEGAAECVANEGPAECWAAGYQALVAAGVAVANRIKLHQFVTSGAIMTASTFALTWKVTLAVGSVVGAVIFLAAALDCFAEQY